VHYDLKDKSCSSHW